MEPLAYNLSEAAQARCLVTYLSGWGRVASGGWYV